MQFARIRRLIMLLVMTGAVCMGSPATMQAQEDKRCFEETGFCIAGRIRDFWEENGGLSVFGYPKTPQREEMIEGKPYQVQWFERNRLELHPENEPPYDVLLGRLGAEEVEAIIAAGTTLPQKQEPQDGCLYFEETGWNVCDAILDVFRSGGIESDGALGLSVEDNLALFGQPLTPIIKRNLGGTHYEVQLFERARFELHPENEPPYHVLLGLMGDEKLAATSDTSTTATPTDTGDFATAKQHNEQGKSLIQEGKYAQAIEAYTQAIELQPNYAEAYNNRGLAYAMQAHHERAIAEYTQAIAHYPDYAEAYNNLGNTYYALGDLNSAIESYTQAIAHYADYAEAYNNRGFIYYEQGNYDQAIADYTQAVTLYPEYAAAFFNRGLTAYQQGAYGQAIADYDRSIEIFGEDATIFYERGRAYAQQGNYDQAIADYNQAIVLRATYANAYYERGNAYAASGYTDLARADYQKVLELSHDPILRQAAEEKLTTTN